MIPARGWLVVAIWAVALLALGSQVNARDLGQWENSDPTIREWYQGLMQNDAPGVSCCGEADSYFCDGIHVRSDKTFCVITDERADEPLKRRHVPIGTEIEIPPNKMNKDPNPTGHSVVFLSSNNYVYCFVFNGGV